MEGYFGLEEETMTESEKKVTNEDTAVAGGIEELRLRAERKRVKLAREASGEIKRLREYGEYAAADGVLDTMQSYLSELKSLETWAIENRMTLDKFEEKAEEWESSYEDAMRTVYGIEPSASYTGKENTKMLAESGNLLLEAGVMPSPQQLAAMGISENDAQVSITAMKLKSKTLESRKRY